MKWYIKVIKQYADFKGRARAQEYWMFVLFNIIFGIAAGILDMILGFEYESRGPINGLYSLAVFIPGLAVSVRRLHDVGKSGWMLLLVLLPIIGWIWLLVLHCTSGDRGANAYGPDPKNPVVEGLL